jgi:hypothetical protein
MSPLEYKGDLVWQSIYDVDAFPIIFSGINSAITVIDDGDPLALGHK